jgi:hypothetical protein
MATAKTKTLNIYQRIQAVMRDVEYIQKEDKKVNNQYRFVSHDAVTAKVRPALIKHGIVITTENINRVQNGNRCEVVVTYRVVNVDDPNDFCITQSCGSGIDNQDKSDGKSLSYSYKYLLLKLFALETGDDPERDSIPHQTAQQQQQQQADTVATNLFAHYEEKMGDRKVAWDTWLFACKKLGVKDPKVLPTGLVPEFAKFINRERAAIQAEMMGEGA